ncbi:venus kinase receptor [Danaus plexippus plexippus]|uniref:Venus kinase receptor n=1 Tax=Danaus plexippus plexippus TaxID=278856 RepID=A0A212EX59_DANPL|nr:venus kinase receptor [Danaus plexippus plexippus]
MCSLVLFLLVLVLSWDRCYQSPCSLLLHRLRERPTEELAVLVNGHLVEVVVWGGGGAPRAAAALLLVALRVRGYRSHLHEAAPDVCGLLDISDLKEAAVVAPAATVPSEDCRRAGLELLTNFLQPAAVSYTLHLWAHVPSDRCRSQAGQWSFYKYYKDIDECGFLKAKFFNDITYGSCSNCFAVLTRNESLVDNQIAMELQTRIDAAELLLQVVSFKSDFIMRKTISELRRLQKPFLFVDEDLWSDTFEMVYVQPPPCVRHVKNCIPFIKTIGNLRLGNGWFMYQFAPPILELVNALSPKSSQLREILNIESAQNESHIENAACSWALQHVEEFKTLILHDKLEQKKVFAIKIILCNHDPLNKYFETISDLINRGEFQNNITHIDYNIYKNTINCFDEEHFRQVITKNAQKKNVAGVIAWSWYKGTTGAAKVAEQSQLPLLLAGAVADEIPLGSAVRAASGRLSDLTRAFHYILENCGWSRIALLSDDSVYSRSFTEAMIKQKNLLYREVIVDFKNIYINLDELKKADARIFLLNVNWSLSKDILNAALKRGMTPNNGFSWIAREWLPIQNNNTDWADMYHFTVSLGWRGEQLEGGSKHLQQKIRNRLHVKESLEEFPGINYLSMFADALLQLGYSFARFYQNYPSYRYNLRGYGTALKLSEVFENMTINGIAQNLSNRNSSIEHPLVFINKWWGVRTKSIGILQITDNYIMALKPTASNFKDLINRQKLRDRPICWTISTGDPFTPRCQDVTIIIVTVFLLISGTALYIARRARLKRLLKRELNILAKLLENRKRAVSSLDTYLVDRNAIKLLHEIGSGTFGRVHFAELHRSGRSTVIVAAKQPRQTIGPTEECEFLHEAYILAPLCHDNIIRLVGICIMNGPPMVLMEHAYYLDLKRYLTERRHLVSNRFNDNTSDALDEVSDESLTRLAREAAGALAYLSTRRLVHRDVRAANCLIDKKRSLKLGDFGMARELDDKVPVYASIRRALFPVLWMAPESLKSGVFSFATDVWALGILILEVVTLGARPYGDWQLSRVLNYVVAGGIPPLPPDVSKHTSSLLHSCWERRAESRPNASWVHNHLTQYPRLLSPALLKPYPPDPLIAYME